VYALGLVLLECLTGRREYDGPPLEVAMSRINRPPDIPLELPGGWRDLLIGMTAQPATSRLSAAQATDRLERLMAGDDATAASVLPPVASATVAMPRPTTVMPQVEPAPVVTAPPPVVPPRRRRAPAVLVTLLVLLIAAGVAVGVYEHDKGSTGHHCATGTPKLPGRLEKDMQALERLACK
jgi:hypothetical protein